MTSLYQAFEDFENETPQQQSIPLPPPPPPKKAGKKEISHQVEGYQQPSPPKMEKFTDYYPYAEKPQPAPQPQYKNQYSFWDRMVMSRREVLKLFILSIVVILGISLEKIGCHYVNQYLSSNDLTTIQELLVRLSFPIIVFIILWIIKSL
jgi:hypothetical protein